MQAATAQIETRSKAQALDWSLVLASEGIDCSILARADDGVLCLEVAEPELARARYAIAAYERENRTVWRREVGGTGMLFDARVLFWVTLVGVAYAWQLRSPDLVRAGMVDYAAVRQGEWWRFFTGMLLHADVGHLAANLGIGFVFLGLAMGALGGGRAVLLAAIGGALGNVATMVLHGEGFRGLGASGMVMAALGLLTAHAVMYARHEKRSAWLGRGVMAGCLLLVLVGFSPTSDVVAHVAGFLFGTLLGVIVLAARNARLRDEPLSTERQK